MHFEVGRLVAWKVALSALVRFLPWVSKGVLLQTVFLTKWLVALIAIVFALTMGLLVKGQIAFTCKCLDTSRKIFLLASWIFTSPFVWLSAVTVTNWNKSQLSLLYKFDLTFENFLAEIFLSPFDHLRPKEESWREVKGIFFNSHSFLTPGLHLWNNPTRA